MLFDFLLLFVIVRIILHSSLFFLIAVPSWEELVFMLFLLSMVIILLIVYVFIFFFSYFNQYAQVMRNTQLGFFFLLKSYWWNDVFSSHADTDTYLMDVFRFKFFFCNIIYLYIHRYMVHIKFNFFRLKISLVDWTFTFISVWFYFGISFNYIYTYYICQTGLAWLINCFFFVI